MTKDTLIYLMFIIMTFVVCFNLIRNYEIKKREPYKRSGVCIAEAISIKCPNNGLMTLKLAWYDESFTCYAECIEQNK